MSLENPWTRSGRVVKIESPKFGGSGLDIHLVEHDVYPDDIQVERLDYVSAATFRQARIRVGDFIEFEYGPYSTPEHSDWRVPALDPRALLARIEALEAKLSGTV